MTEVIGFRIINTAAVVAAAGFAVIAVDCCQLGECLWLIVYQTSPIGSFVV